MLKIRGIRSTWRRNNSVSKDLISSDCCPDDQLMGVRLFRGVSSSSPRKKIGWPLEESRWSEIKLSSRFYHALHSLSRHSDRDISCDVPAPVICQAARKYLWETRNSCVFTHMDCRFVDKMFRYKSDKGEPRLFQHDKFQNTSRLFYK